jgi:hypothetical protein
VKTGERCPHCGAPNITKVLSAQEIAEHIAGRYGYDLSELRAQNRSQAACTMRKLIAGVLRSAGFSYPVIGRVLHRHHTTILSGQQSVQRAIAAGFGEALPRVPWNADAAALNPLQTTPSAVTTGCPDERSSQ